MEVSKVSEGFGVRSSLLFAQYPLFCLCLCKIFSLLHLKEVGEDSIFFNLVFNNINDVVINPVRSYISFSAYCNVIMSITLLLRSSYTEFSFLGEGKHVGGNREVGNVQTRLAIMPQ